MVIKQLYFVIALLTATNCFAQTERKVSSTLFAQVTNVSRGADEYAFPIVAVPDKKAQKKINIHLQLSELDLIKGYEKKDIFEKVAINNGTIYGGKVSIAYEVKTNNNRNLAIKFTEESCGMTCTYWVRYYNFNPQNGDRYFIQDFFTKENFSTFRAVITPVRKKQVQKQIKELLAAGEDVAHIEEYLYTYIEEDELDDFYFTSDSVFFDNENLLIKHDKFLDLNHITGFSIAEIKHLLNQFGQAALVTAKELKDHRALTEPQLYEGTIDKASKFYLLFKNDYQNHFRGTYAYKKYGVAIYLEGEKNNNSFLFKEKNDAFADVASVSFQQQGLKLSGFWTGNKNKKLAFTAIRM